MAKKVIETPAVEATAGVTSKEEAVTTTSTNVEGITNTQEVPETPAENAEQAELIKDLQQKLEAAGIKIKSLENALNNTHGHLANVREEYDALVFEAKAKDEEIEKLRFDSLVIDSEHLEEAEAKTYFEYNGRRYGFTDRAPKRLSFDGQLFTQEELLNDEDSMISLIVGESAFVKRII